MPERTPCPNQDGDLVPMWYKQGRRLKQAYWVGYCPKCKTVVSWGPKT